MGMEAIPTVLLGTARKRELAPRRVTGERGGKRTFAGDGGETDLLLLDQRREATRESLGDVANPKTAGMADFEGVGVGDVLRVLRGEGQQSK
jgi:hypothetical protein